MRFSAVLRAGGDALQTAVYVPKRENPIVNRLNKTKAEREVDHEQERVERIKEENVVKRGAAVAKVNDKYAFTVVPTYAESSE